jgi:anti-sigma B factor antagonist
MTSPNVTPDTRTRGQLASEIANGIVRLWRDRAGTGPKRARAHVTDGFVTCVMEGTLTPAERTLADAGRADLVRRQRAELRWSMRDDAVALVERITGRRVLSALGDTAVEPDHAVDVFILGEDLPGRRRAAPSKTMAGPATLQVRVIAEATRVRVRPEGDLDLAGVEALAPRIEAARATSLPMVIELDGVGFLDSSGLNLILATWEAAQRDGHPFTLTRGPANVHRVFQIAGLDEILPFERAQ